MNEQKLNEAAKEYANQYKRLLSSTNLENIAFDFKAGAKWYSEQEVNKPDLFDFFANEHNLILTDTELNDIIYAVKHGGNQTHSGDGGQNKK